MDKGSELVKAVKQWVDKEYAGGRVTVLTDEELVASCRNASRTGVLLTPSSSPIVTSFNSSCSSYLPFKIS